MRKRNLPWNAGYAPDPDGPVGVFDSGVGGLTVLAEIRRLLPNESVVYFGDTARVPYGPKSRPIIRRYTEEIVRFLLTKRVKAIVIACNTSTAVAGAEVARSLTLPVIGVIGPACKLAASVTTRSAVGVIGTRGTVKSRAYVEGLHAIDPKLRVVQKACPLFVPVAEEGLVESLIAETVAAHYLAPFKTAGIDTLILGCTHYPLLRPVIERAVGRGVNVIDSATQTALALKSALAERKLAAKSGATAHLRFHCSDSPTQFKEHGERFLGFAIPKVTRVKVWELPVNRRAQDSPDT